MIEFEAVTLAYAGRPVLGDITFEVPEGELLLVVGPTGSGKSSLLSCLDADLTRHHDADSLRLTGRVLVDGVDVHAAEADGRRPLVRRVRQDPGGTLGPGTVESVIAAGVRAREADPHAGQRQVEETLDLLGIADLRSRPVTELSGGQQQRVAIGLAVVAAPRVLVLDEPTSALDPVAAEDVLAILHRLVHDVGTTVMVAEHRLERVVHHADAVLLVESGRVRGPLEPAAAMAVSALHPPVVELGLRLGWDPVALSVREARRSARALRSTLGSAPPPAPVPGAAPTPGTATPLVDVRRLSASRGSTVALRSVDLRVEPGEVVALMGRNGSGKSTLLATLDGALPPRSGRVSVTGASALAPQDPGDLLSDVTVADQLTTHDAAHHLVAGTSAAVLGRIAPDLRDLDGLDDLDGLGGLGGHRTADLSEGQRMCVALSVVLARGTALLLLDEPTRGLDYAAKERLTTILAERADAGCAVVVATHDVELAAQVATRVVLLAEGEVIADAPAREVLADSPAFAPQVAKVLHPLPFLRVTDVLTAVEGHRSP